MADQRYTTRTANLHKCGICSYETDSKEDIEAHVQIPENTLPIGLVLKKENAQWVPAIITDKWKIDKNHDRKYLFYHYQYIDTVIWEIQSALVIKDGLKGGHTKLYSEEEFERIKPRADELLKRARKTNITLIRTTPELEEIVNERK